jgi:hypothetical protein
VDVKRLWVLRSRDERPPAELVAPEDRVVALDEGAERVLDAVMESDAVVVW